MKAKETLNSPKNAILTLVGLILIIYLSLHHISKLNIPYVFGDEFGYWGNAAFFAGKNWSDLLATNKYYQVGYSLLLLPLFNIGKYSSIYHAAIVINAVLLSIKYLLVIQCSRLLFDGVRKDVSVYLALVCVLIEDMFQSQIAWSEDLLSCLMWIFITLAIAVEKTYSIHKFFVLNCVLFFMCLTHLRSVVLFPAIMVFSAVLAKKNNSKRIIILELIFLIISWGTTSLIKSGVMDLIYSGNELLAVNDVNLKTVSTIMSKLLNNFILVGWSLLGHIFISLFETMLTLFVPLAYLFTNLKNRNLKVQNDSFIGVKLAIIISYVSLFLLECIQTLSIHRKDFLFYTRYSSFCFSPYFALAFYLLISEWKLYKKIVRNSLLIIIGIGKLLSFRYSFQESFFAYPHSPFLAGIIYFFKNRLHIEDFIIVAVFIVFISIIIALLYYFKHNSIIPLLIMIIICVISYENAYKWSDEERSYVESNVSEVADVVSQISPDTIIYFVNEKSSKDGYVNAKYLQFLISDVHIKMSDVLTGDGIYISDARNDLRNIDGDMELLATNKLLNIYRRGE